jgi:hypothetical protein
VDEGCAVGVSVAATCAGMVAVVSGVDDGSAVGV